MSQVIAGLIVAPIERVHILMQCQNEMLKSDTLSIPYKGMKDCLLRTIKHEGVFSLWRGYSLRVFEIVGVPTILSMIIVKKQQAEQKKIEDITLIQSLSLVMIQALHKQPLDYARTRLACDVKAARILHNYSLDSSPRSISNGVGNWKFSGVFDVYYKTLKLDGVHGLYRGCTAACVGMFVNYETSKQIRSRDTTSKENKGRRGFIVLSLKATLPFLVTSVVHYPFITVNRRMMMTSGETTKYKGALDAIHQILKHEGVSTLYKGVTPFIIHRLVFSYTTIAVLISASYGLNLMK
ncbi:ADP,ATP carrier protein 1, mitochondrial isoform X2 [Beta vulgaris subsp. vulgaris]|nr:ADP,ATP carrier protein 1, mitochondrial isoform X2 [Beta vulgaris subsp. vulgaris]